MQQKTRDLTRDFPHRVEKNIVAKRPIFLQNQASFTQKHDREFTKNVTKMTLLLVVVCTGKYSGLLAKYIKYYP